MWKLCKKGVCKVAITQDEQLDFLIDILVKEESKYNNIVVPQDLEEKKKLFRTLCNIRLPKEVSLEFLEVEKEYLQIELFEKGVVKLGDLVAIDKNIYLWQGDITRLEVDGIVNACNSKLLGCFHPLHNCIDNQIHSFASVELRNQCNKIMVSQGFDEPNGKAKITSGYNLPCKYVIHTVGPIVYGEVTEENIRDLKNCYLECLKLADSEGLKSIAFCCLSTGEFCYPNEEAGKLAIATVKEYLEKTKSGIEVVFNVFKDIDYEIYRRVLTTN